VNAGGDNSGRGVYVDGCTSPELKDREMLIENVELSPRRPRQVAVLVPLPSPARELEPQHLDELRLGTELFTVQSMEQDRQEILLSRTGLPPLAAQTEQLDAGLSPGQIVMAPASRDWLRRRSYYVGGVVEWEPVEGTEREWTVDVPLIRVHRPNHTGCEAEYSVGRETASGGSFKLTIGVSIGGEATITAKATETYKAKDSCIQVLSKATLATALFRVRVNGEEVRQEWDADVVDVAQNVKDPGALPPDQDGCNVPYEEAERLPEFESWDLSQPRDPDAEKEIEFGQVSKGTLGITLTEAPVELELGLERETTTTTSVASTLVQGRRYSVYVPRSGSTLERCWTADLPA
jgi:hypothetical protein